MLYKSDTCGRSESEAYDFEVYRKMQPAFLVSQVSSQSLRKIMVTSLSMKLNIF